MKSFNLLIVSILIFCLYFSCNEKQVLVGNSHIIPLPENQVIGKGKFEINSKTIIVVENEIQEKIARQFSDQFESVSGWKPQIGFNVKGDIVFKEDANLAEEGYLLDVSPKKIVINAGSGSGFFYAIQTLKQMLPPKFFGAELVENVVWAIPAIRINDQPAFEWRGYMLDVSRHFFDVKEVKKVLDFMAASKLNRFHWHLADDQGWRLEIKSYPKLTEVGAWRMDYNITDETQSNWFGRPTQKPGEKPTYGGFYTQEEVKEIVAYAKERYIEVIPEIDMPGHAQATVAAYPEIGCVNAEPFVATGGVYKNNTYNPGKEVTFEFAETMLNEVMELFPYNYVHIGGDECNKDQWKVDPDAQRRIKEEGLKDEFELQSYFIQRIEKIINKKGRIMIGWDEILEGGLAPNATLMSWRGEKGGIIAAKAGHEVIMTPNKYCYIDLKQGHDDLEPNLGYSELLLSTAYGYNVIPKGLNAEEGKLIKGIQANMWTESISDWGKLTYMTFPRLYAIAETGWTKQENKNWNSFTNRLYSQFEILDKQQVRYAVSAFSPWIDHKAVGKEIEISLSTEVNDLTMHFTLDGTEPSVESPKYTAPFKIVNSALLKVKAFKNGKNVGYLSEREFAIHKAAGLGKDSDSMERLTDLNYGKLNSGDRNWVAFDKGKPLEIILKFDELTEVKEVSFDALRFTISGIYPPEEVTVYGSENGKDYRKLGNVNQAEIGQTQGRNKVRTKVSFESSKLIALKIVGTSVNPIPKGHHRAGEGSKIKVDEIIVN